MVANHSFSSSELDISFWKNWLNLEFYIFLSILFNILEHIFFYYIFLKFNLFWQFSFWQLFIYLENIKHLTCMFKKIKKWIPKKIIYLSYIKVTKYFDPLHVIHTNSHISKWTILSRSLPHIPLSLENFSLCCLLNKQVLHIN